MPQIERQKTKQNNNNRIPIKLYSYNKTLSNYVILGLQRLYGQVEKESRSFAVIRSWFLLPAQLVTDKLCHTEKVNFLIYEVGTLRNLLQDRSKNEMRYFQ